MTFTYENITGMLTLIYETAHKTAYVRETSKQKKFMLTANARLFSRFFHSALVKGTLLSPANILALANKHFGNKEYKNPTGRIISHPKQPYDTAFSDTLYSADNHPVIRDLRLFIECISPDIKLTRNNRIPQTVIRAVMGEMAVSDNEYIEFIHQICIALKIAQITQGINVTMLTVTEEADDFFALPAREALMKVTQEAAKACAFAFSKIMTGHTIPVSAAYVISLLKEPNYTRDVYAYLYLQMLDSFRHLLSKNAEIYVSTNGFKDQKPLSELSEQELYSVFISCSFVLNSSYALAFVTVFADYLKLINPFYEDVITFRELAYYAASISDGPEGLYLPPSHYTLTPVAVDLFELPEDTKYNAINTKVPLSAIIEAIPNHAGRAKQTPLTLAAKYAKPGDVCALRLKITSLDNQELWKTIEFSDQFTLEQLHFTICDEFMIEPADEYSFNTSMDFNMFTSYTPASHKSKIKKTHKTRLCDLPIDEKSAFFYCIYRSLASYLIRYPGTQIKSDMYIIEVVKVKLSTGLELYPQIIRESPAIIEQMEPQYLGLDFDIFDLFK